MKPRRALRPESANRCKVIDSLSLRNTPLLFHGKHLASCGVAAGPKLCCRAHLLINIYIFLHSHLSLGKCCICRSDCGLKRTHNLKKKCNLFLLLVHYLLIYSPKVCVDLVGGAAGRGRRGEAWQIWSYFQLAPIQHIELF